MPGLRLTIPQAARLWGLDLTSCKAVIDLLYSSGLLRLTSAECIVRREG